MKNIIKHIKLKIYQNRVNVVFKFLFGYDRKRLPDTVQGCKDLLKYYEENFNVIY
jgi:hypothetical protein